MRRAIGSGRNAQGGSGPRVVHRARSLLNLPGKTFVWALRAMACAPHGGDTPAMGANPDIDHVRPTPVLLAHLPLLLEQIVTSSLGRLGDIRIERCTDTRAIS